VAQKMYKINNNLYLGITSRVSAEHRGILYPSPSTGVHILPNPLPSLWTSYKLWTTPNDFWCWHGAKELHDANQK